MRYSKSHEWVDQQGRIGITNHAQKELGEIVYVELPKVGYKVAAGEQIAVLESTKAAIDLYSPIAGVVVDVNQGLKEHPDWLNSSPEDKGWIVRLSITDTNAYNSLLDKDNYQSYINN